MITFEPIIIPNNKRNDGTYPVKIRVYFNGKSRRLPTTWVCHPSDITRTKRKSVKIKKDSGVRDKAKELIDLLSAERFFFATDFPMWDACGERERFERIPLTPREREMIYAENIKRVLRL
jgi:hypothetical protein